VQVTRCVRVQYLLSELYANSRSFRVDGAPQCKRSPEAILMALSALQSVYLTVSCATRIVTWDLVLFEYPV
jgi:hypothetical protein